LRACPDGSASASGVLGLFAFCGNRLHFSSFGEERRQSELSARSQVSHPTLGSRCSLLRLLLLVLCALAALDRAVALCETLARDRSPSQPPHPPPCFAAPLLATSDSDACSSSPPSSSPSFPSVSDTQRAKMDRRVTRAHDLSVTHFHLLLALCLTLCFCPLHCTGC
jgi:hypothetical protein